MTRRSTAARTALAISVTAHDNPFTMASVRWRVGERLEGDAACVVYLVEPERACMQAIG